MSTPEDHAEVKGPAAGPGRAGAGRGGKGSARPLLREVPADHSVEIGWLDGHDLLDPNLYLHPLAHPPATGGRIGKPEEWEAGYLDWVRTSVIPTA